MGLKNAFGGHNGVLEGTGKGTFLCVCVCWGGGRRNTAFGERNDAFYASSEIYKFSEL